MTSLGMFSYYKQWAYKIFNYLQPRICKYTKCNLEIFYMNQLNGVAFGTISRPNTIMIYIDNAVSYIGNENNIDSDVTVIQTKYKHGGEEGTIAIIGPKRMEYDRVVGLLEFIKENIER